MKRYDHTTLVLAGILAIVVGMIDAHTGAVLSQAGDIGLVIAGFASLGLKIGASVVATPSDTPAPPPPPPPAGG